MKSTLTLTCLLLSFAQVSPGEPKPKISSEGILEIPSVPHVRVHTKERYVDVDAEVCLHEGLLELVACGKDGKVHESILALEARAKHVHLMLVLLGVKPGHPPRWEPLDESGKRFRDVPARGQEIQVSLVFENSEGERTERSIADFIQDRSGNPLPTDRFLFSGSVIEKETSQHPVYRADQSGHVITLSSFGDEVLSYPEMLSHANAELSWEVVRKDLPEVGSKVILRLRPIHTD